VLEVVLSGYEFEGSVWGEETLSARVFKGGWIRICSDCC